jgi:hypothetical protein
MPCPLSLYKERDGAPPCTHNHTINPTQKATHRLDIKAVTQKRAQTSINRSSLCITAEFCIRRSPPNIALGTRVSCQSSNIDNDPHHLGVPSGETKMISDPMVRSTQTMDLSCIKISIISKQTELSLEPHQLGVSSGAPKQF